jgi:uncharacterized protein (TIGR00251 family)
MIRYTQDGDALVFTVRVVPRASRSEIAGEHDGALRVRVAAPPVEGAANVELVRTLSRAFKVPSSAVLITSGHSSKVKQLRVSGAAVELLEMLCAEKLK